MRDAGPARRAGRAVAERPAVLERRLVGRTRIGGLAVELHRPAPVVRRVRACVDRRLHVGDVQSERLGRRVARVVGRRDDAGVVAVVRERVLGIRPEADPAVGERPAHGGRTAVVGRIDVELDLAPFVPVRCDRGSDDRRPVVGLERTEVVHDVRRTHRHVAEVEQAEVGALPQREIVGIRERVRHHNPGKKRNVGRESWVERRVCVVRQLVEEVHTRRLGTRHREVILEGDR